MRTKKGVVTSAKMTGTVTVIVHSYANHPIYRKKYRKSKKFAVDSTGYDLVAGDTVVITECRPLSKRKHFKVTEVLEQIARVSDVQEEEGLEKAMYREKKKEAVGEAPASAEATGDKEEGEEAKESTESSPSPEA